MSTIAPPTLSAGQVIDGKYRIERAAGVGGFGEVYLAVHVATSRRVALKVLRSDRESGSDAHRARVAALMEEARLLAKLSDPHIVLALDAGIHGGARPQPYVVLEWCEGPTLKDWLATKGRPLSLAECWALLGPVVDAVAHAHASGVAHRDLKPGNVLFDGDTLRVIDFGIAKAFGANESVPSGETQTRSPSSPHSPAYAAPEQVKGARTGPWTDVHALALLFVEALTGNAPYGEAASVGAVAPERPSPRAHGVDAGPFEAVLRKALSMTPRDRYRDAGELAAALDRAAHVAGLPARPGRAALRAQSRPPDEAAADELTSEEGSPSSETVASTRAPEVRGRFGLRSGSAGAPFRRWRWLALVGALLVIGGVTGWALHSVGRAPSRAGASAVASQSGPPTGRGPASSTSPLPGPDRSVRALAELDVRELEARARAGVVACGLGEATFSHQETRTLRDRHAIVTWTGRQSGHVSLTIVDLELVDQAHVEDEAAQLARAERATGATPAVAIDLGATVVVSAENASHAACMLDKVLLDVAPITRTDGAR